MWDAAAAWVRGHDIVLLVAAVVVCLAMIATLWATRPRIRPHEGRHRRPE